LRAYSPRLAVSQLRKTYERAVIIETGGKTLNNLCRCTRVLALVMMFAPSAGLAQLDQAISDASLTDPWNLEKAVVLSLPTGTPAPNEPQIRSQIHATLSKLDEGLARFESQILTFIEHLVGDPQYPYVAAENSAEMSAQIAGIEKNFDSLYTAFDLEKRTDVRAAQASLGTLKSTLAQKTPFEHDVNRALGSGSRQEILSFATRWWTATEHSIAVRKAVADLKQRLEASTPAH
jgi:hypothetical protein